MQRVVEVERLKPLKALGGQLNHMMLCRRVRGVQHRGGAKAGHGVTVMGGSKLRVVEVERLKPLLPNATNGSVRTPTQPRNRATRSRPTTTARMRIRSHSSSRMGSSHALGQEPTIVHGITVYRCQEPTWWTASAFWTRSRPSCPCRPVEVGALFTHFLIGDIFRYLFG